MRSTTWGRVIVLALVAAMLPVAGRAADEAGGQKAGPKPVVAVFSFGGAITEKPMGDDFLFGAAGESFQSLISRLQKVVNDDAVRGVVLTGSSVSLGTSQIEEVRQVLARIRQAGKPVWANVDALSMGSYLLLSGCDRLSVVPTGDVWITGLYGESPYLKGLLDKLGVEPDFTTCGEYKSAAEMFMRSEPSPAAQQNRDWLMDGIFSTYLDLIATGRKVDVEQARKWIDHGLYSAEGAVKSGIIDVVEHRQEFVAALKQKFGDDVRFDKKYGKRKSTDIDLSSPFGLLKFYTDLLTGGSKKTASKKDAVAIVYVEGMILPGTGDSSGFSLLTGGMAYSTPIRKALDEAAADDAVKAVVLRVDSPGGSAVASEIILDATRRVAAKKPYIVSMGNVAGSGGYYVACGTKTIFADTSTITGSIGVVGGKLATNPMWQKVGVNWKPTKRGHNAGILSSGDQFTGEQRQLLQGWMDEVYGVFKGHVTAIRGDKLKKPIDELAGGRVYTGKQALELGLVDRLGSLDDAIRFVAGEAKLDQYEIRVIPQPKNFLELLMSDLQGSDEDSSSVSTALRGLTGHSDSLLEAALPHLKGLEPQRLRAVLTALGQAQLLQQERVLMTMPPIHIAN